MIRISKLTDYGILLLTTMARDPGCTMFTARDLAERTRLPQPTVGKLLKDLSKGNFLASERGMRGGYRLSRGPGLITVAEVVTVLEGPISVTECAASAHTCEIQGSCATRGHWKRINETIQSALSKLTLADLIRPVAAMPVGISRSTGAESFAAAARKST